MQRRRKTTLSMQINYKRVKKRKETEEFESLSRLAAEQEAQRRSSEQIESLPTQRPSRESDEEQLCQNTEPLLSPEDCGGVDFGEEEQRTEEEGNEEPETDFPLSNMNRIYRYLGKEGEHRLLELKDQVTSNPRVFGAQLEKLVVPENKEEMRRFLKKVVQLKEEIKSEEDLLTTIDRESGAQEFAFPDGCVLKEAEFFYCLNHGDPLFQNTNVCTQCFQIFQNDHPGERGDPKNFRCLKGFKYNVGEGIANVLNNLGKGRSRQIF